MFSGVKAAFCSLGLRQSRLTRGERVCTHHEFCREQIALDPVLDCDDCFSELLRTISLAPSSAITGGGGCLRDQNVRKKAPAESWGALKWPECL